MLKKIVESFIGSKSERAMKTIQPIVDQINALEEEISKLSDAELRAKTPEFKERLAKGETLDDLLPEAFACVREASKRTIKLRHYDVQLKGGIVLHRGNIAEMRTGEGKTLVSTLPAYLNALTGHGVHIVTVNDYLAKRDSAWMAPVHEFLGLTVGSVQHDMKNEDRREMYRRDITYITNNEVGFDYLRDNMVMDAGERVMRERNFAVVDEVDSILVDEARTPLIISGQADDNVTLYQAMNAVPPRLERQEREYKEDEPLEKRGPVGDYVVDEKQHQVTLTERGHERVKRLL